MIKPFFSVRNAGIFGAGSCPSYHASSKSGRTRCCQHRYLTMHFTSRVRTPGGHFSTYLHQKNKIRKARDSISFKTLRYRPNSCVASTNTLPFFANIPLALNTKLFLEVRPLWPGSSSGSGGLRVPHTGRAVVTHWQGHEEWGSAARCSKRQQSAPRQGCSSPCSEQVRVCSNTGPPTAGSTLAHRSLGALQFSENGETKY